MYLFENYITQNKSEFLIKVKEIALDLGVHPNWLMGVFYKESRLNHRAVNAIGGATGLIQFMPKTALSLGTSTSQLLSMSNVQQLDYVYKYYKPYRGKIKSYVDLYLVTFFPIAIGKPESWVLQSNNLSSSVIALQNKGIDLDKNGQITVGEFTKYCFTGFSTHVIELLKKKLI